jgi:hypothetical protein
MRVVLCVVVCLGRATIAAAQQPPAKARGDALGDPLPAGAVEPSYQRQDAQEYLHRARGKLSKLRRVAEFFGREYRRVSDHTNFQMAAASLSFCVDQLDDVLAAVEPGQERVAAEDSPPTSP